MISIVIICFCVAPKLNGRLKECKIRSLNNGNRTEWSPIRSVVIQNWTRKSPFYWVQQSNKIEHLFCCEVNYWTNWTKYYWMQSYSMQFDSVLKPFLNQVNHAGVQCNHNQPLLNGINRKRPSIPLGSWYSQCFFIRVY